MTGQNSVRSFLRAAMIVAALAGVAAGILLATNETVRAWHVEGMTPGDMAYAVAVAGLLLLSAVIYLASSSARTTPILPLALIVLVFGIALGGLSHHKTAMPEGLIETAAYVFDGLGMGLLLAYWMMRRTGRKESK